MSDVIMTLSEKQKILILDYNECFGHAYANLIIGRAGNISQACYEFLYNNKFRINGVDFVYVAGKDPSTGENIYRNNEYQMYDASTAANTMITVSIESLDGIDKLGDDISFNIFIGLENSIKNFVTIYITGRALPKYNIYNNVANTIDANMESFMLMRTNPKLTGNIKLVVTDDNCMYLDTFKVSKTSLLNKTEYRHKAVSGEGNYAHDVYRIFKTVPKGEMYRIYDDSYAAHKNYYDPNLQIENIYEYGAEYNTDKLYSENMKILAPLHIGKNLPTYFAIFRTDNLINKTGFDDMEVFDDMLTNAECIKIYDLRLSTPLGKYLNNYKSQITKYLSGTCALQFIEQDNSTGTTNYRQGRNTWKGLVYDKGIFADMTETSYFANQILQSSSQRQERYNMFLLDGFSRNNILYPNIINLEFMFNDKDSADMSMHNYFGLYLTENDFMTFNQVIYGYDKSKNTDITYYDTDNKEVNINDTRLKILDTTEYDNRIFFGTTMQSAKYLRTMKDFNRFIIEDVANKPYENLVSAQGDKIEMDCKSFITMTFNEQIHYGEHFKFINKSANTVYELVASNDINLLGFDGYVSQYVQSNFEDDVKVFRMTFYTQDEEDPTQPATLPVQIERMQTAINEFGECIFTGSVSSDTLSVTSDVKNIYFQHILAIGSEETDTIAYFNRDNTYTCTYLSEYNAEYMPDHLVFACLKFENYGSRLSNIIKFINTASMKSVYEIDTDIYKQMNMTAYPLVSTVNGYYPVMHISVDNYTLKFSGTERSSAISVSSKYQKCVISPYNVDNCLISSYYDIQIYNKKINICSPMKANVALMGINAIKDFDAYVNINEYYQNESVIRTSFTAGETVLTDGSDNRLHPYVTYILISGHVQGLPINANSKFMITYDNMYYTAANAVYSINKKIEKFVFDSNSVIELAYTGAFDKYQYNVYKPYMAEDNFYNDPLDTLNSYLDIPLIPAVNCQWRSNGTYFDTLSSINTDTFNNYTLSGNFVENIYMPDKTNNQYIPNRLNDTIQISGGDKMTVKEFITKYGYKNAIRKYLGSDFKVDTAIGYYNQYVNSLEFIYYGIRFTFKLTNTQYTNEIKLHEYNNYEVFVMNDYNSQKENEIYISKNEEFILIINHTYRACPQYVSDDLKILATDIADAQYNWYKAPYNYDLIHTSALNDTLTIQKTNYYELPESEDIRYTVEIDQPQYEVFNETPVYFAIDMANCSTFETFDNFKKDADGKFDFLINKKNYECSTYVGDVNNIYERYNDTLVDFRDKAAYIVKKESTPLTRTYTQKINDYIDSFDADMELNIINGNECQTFHINDSYRPMTLTMQIPNQIKFNQGLFGPNFVDIFKFELFDGIGDILDLDTLQANTKVKSINPIRNMYYNKIMNANMKCAYNYFCKSQFSPLTTSWDDNIYRLYDDDTTYNDTTGYILGINDKMMFGSKCLVTHHNEMYISSWDYTANNNSAVYASSASNVNSSAQQNLVITLNVTDAFFNMLSQIPEFRQNWNKVGQVSNITVYMNNYINNTLSKIYDMNNPELILYGMHDGKIASAGSASRHFIKEQPEDITKYTLINNADVQYYNMNNKILATLTIQDYKGMKFYPVLKINKI